MASHQPPWLTTSETSNSRANANRQSAIEDPRFEDIFNHWVDEQVYLGDEIPPPNSKLKRHPPRSSSKGPPGGRRTNADASRSNAGWNAKGRSNQSGQASHGQPPSNRKGEASKDSGNAAKPHRYFADTNASTRTVHDTPKTLTQAAPTKAGPANPLGEFIPFERPPSPQAVLETIYLRSKSLSGYVPQKGRAESNTAQSTRSQKSAPDSNPPSSELMIDEPVISKSQPQPFQWSETAFSGHEASSDSPPSATANSDQKTNGVSWNVNVSGAGGFKEDTSPEEEEEGAIEEDAQVNSEVRIASNDQWTENVSNKENGRKGMSIPLTGPKVGVQSIVDGRIFIEIDSDMENPSTDEAMTQQAESMTAAPSQEAPTPPATTSKDSRATNESGSIRDSETRLLPQESETESDNSDHEMRDGTGDVTPPPHSAPHIMSPVSWDHNSHLLSKETHAITKGVPLSSKSSSPRIIRASTENAGGNAHPRLFSNEEEAPFASRINDVAYDMTKSEPIFDEDEIRQCGLYVRANAECQTILQRIVSEIAAYQNLRRMMNRVKSQLPTGVIPTSLSIISEADDPKIDSALGRIKGLVRFQAEQSTKSPSAVSEKRQPVKTESTPAVDMSNRSARKSTIPPPRILPAPVNKVSVKSKSKKRVRSGGLKKKALKRQQNSASAATN